LGPRCRLVFTFVCLAFCAGARGDVAIWAEGCIAKVKPDKPPPAETCVWDGERISVKAARGEWEPFQVVINSDQARVVAFEIYDLEGARGRFAASNISIYRELFLPVNWPSVDRATNFTVGLGGGMWPDPLVPVIGHADVAGGRNTVFWFDLYVPPGTAAGKYVGAIVFKWSGGERLVPLELAVWDFELSRGGASPVFVAGVDADDACRLYGVEPDSAAAQPILENYYALLREHGFEAVGGDEAKALSPERAGGLLAKRGFSEYAEFKFEEGEAYRELLDGLRDKGVAVVYTAESLAGYIDRPAGDHRLVGWALWRFGGDVVWLGNVSYFPAKKAKPLSDDPRNEFGNGAGALIYPGTELGLTKPLPSIRLKLLREAAEDYEYLSTLKGAGLEAYADELATGVVPRLPHPAAEGLEPTSFYEAREAGALAIVKSEWRQGIAENAVNGRAVSDEGTAVAGAVVRVGPLAAVTDRDGNYELRYVPRGRTLAAAAPGYENAGASGAGGRGDFVLKQLLRRYLLNAGEEAGRFSDKGFETAARRPSGNVSGGPALVGRLKGNRAGTFEFQPALRDWRTFGALVLELYNDSPARVTATVRVTDEAGAFYEEIFFLTPGAWEPARIDLGLARRRFYLEAKASGWNLEFEEKARIDVSAAGRIEVAFEGGGGDVRVGRVWLEAGGD